MDKTLLQEVILEQEKIPESIDLGIQREQLSLLSQYQHMPHALVISGIRRVGKSTLLAQTIDRTCKRKIYYLNFEDERLLNFNVNDFNQMYEIFLQHYGEKKIFVFDEIQNAPKWEIFVRRMQDKGHRFFLTGSNASLLSRELGTKLTGRCLVVELYPFSFKEFLKFKGNFSKEKVFLDTKQRASIKRYFNEYLREGGMPEYLKYKDPIVLKRVYEDILYRDIVARFEIKEIHALRELAFYLLSNVSTLYTYHNLKKILKLGSANTVKSYIDYLENSFLMFSVNRFSYSLKKQYMAPKKIYCIDNGLIEAISFQFSKNKGKFLENMVFIELKRRGNEIFYYKTANDLEIDFLIRNEKRKISLIQVTENLNTQKVRDREINALVNAMQELKLNNGLILTEDTEETFQIKNKKITIIPIYKWLLL